MSKAILLLTFVLTLSLSMVVRTVSAQERAAGVSVGEWFIYEQSDVEWSSNYPNATFPDGRPVLEEINETAWFMLSVQNVVDTVEYFQTLKHFRNETEKTTIGFVDIDTGSHNMSYLAISANLNQNDTVYTHIFSFWKIDDTEVRTYANSSRETNHMNYTREMPTTFIYNGTTYNGTTVEMTNYYWDRASGIPVEFSYREVKQTGIYESNISYSYLITESSTWAVSEFPTFLIVPVFMIVTLVATRKRGRLHHSPTKIQHPPLL